MKTFEIVTDVKDGKFHRNQNRIREAMASFNEKTVILTIQVQGKERTPKQNSYYWAVIVVIWQKLIETEWVEFFTLKEVHEFLKYNCNYMEKVNEETGEFIHFAKSTKSNTTTDQEEFHEKCRRLAMDMFNTEIPLPKEQIKLEL